MTRAEHEDAILALLRAAMPQGVKVESVPRGLDDPKARDVRAGAVWVVYEGGMPQPGQDPSSPVHAEAWAWSVICLAKTYRSDQVGAATALTLLEAVVDALDGAEIECRDIVRIGDRLLPLPAEVEGLIGYEAQFSVEVLRDRK